MYDAHLADIHLLLISILALAVGPVLHQLARLADSMLAALDGFVFVAIGGLVLLHIIPESIILGGWLAVLGALAGLLAPSLVEHRLHGLARQAHMAALLLALIGIALHAFMDGLALVAPGSKTELHEHHMLPLAVILHRLPVGLTIWFLLRPLYGVRTALAALGLIALATAAGFVFGGVVAKSIESQARGIFQALVAGSLFHVVVHRSYPAVERSTRTDGGRFQAGLGALGGLGLLWAITWDHGVRSMVAAILKIFYTLIHESALWWRF